MKEASETPDYTHMARPVLLPLPELLVPEPVGLLFGPSPVSVSVTLDNLTVAMR